VYCCLAFPVRAQPPEFDVASIKPNPSPPPRMKIGPDFNAHGYSFSGSEVTLLDLVVSAYGVTAPRVIGPSWLDGDRFDVAAKAPEGASLADLRAMAQTMLKERFHLQAHVETREMPVYDLVVAKGGVKMAKPPGPVPQDTGKAYPGVTNIATSRGTGTTAQIADILSRRAGRPVIDKTSLDGKYDFALTWMPNLPTAGDAQAELGPPDLFRAIQEQLGLKLQPSTAQLTVVVVDHMDRMSTEN
jgi:uncharacterized protein (TIGR03435 family)